MVYFVGAGTGAADLITVRGARLLKKADVIVYAGSLVNPELLNYAKKDCEIYNSATMTLEEVMSIHGREADVPGAVRKEKKIFLILSGAADARKLGNDLMAAGLPSVRLAFGYQLSYPEEWIRVLSPEESAKLSDEGLYACFILNDAPEAKRLSPGVSDEEFIRDKVPMTKEEIREVSICALGLTENAVVYDVGSGTGSVAVECALLSDTIRVLAIERLPEAVSLIRRNKEKFRLSNMGKSPARWRRFCSAFRQESASESSLLS